MLMGWTVCHSIMRLSHFYCFRRIFIIVYHPYQGATQFEIWRRHAAARQNKLASPVCDDDAVQLTRRNYLRYLTILFLYRV